MAPSKKSHQQYGDSKTRSSWNGDRDVRDFDSAEIAERRGLLPFSSKQPNSRITSRVRQRHDQRLRALLDTPSSTLDEQRRRDDWMRPYWLGGALFLVLFPFWLLDSLKDPVFGALIWQGQLQENLPTAKLFSVFTTLVLVCGLEYLAQERQRRRDAKRVAQQQNDSDSEDILDGGGRWKRMSIATSRSEQYWDEEDDEDELGSQDRVPISIFATIGVPYCLFFGLVAYLLQFNPATALVPGGGASHVTVHSRYANVWHVLGYFVYAAIESYGSLAVATFWSYTNSTLSLDDAEAFYGTIIAMAQCGAIVGSTMVTMHLWSSITLFITACLLILLHILVMMAYARRFPPTTNVAAGENEPTVLEGFDATTASNGNATASASVGINNQSKTSLWSGIHLILKHNYVLLILGVSCLYEVSLTCLNYQMTLLGWSRFEESPSYDPDNSTVKSMSFTQFMGHYGQMVNIFSLILSSIVFPPFIRRLGLKYTLRIFPTLLLLVNVVAFGAIPGNLTVLFFSMSILKAMTYSIHDPSKEILYIPTSNAIKFKSKFWIDVVGARFAKAIGSSINAHAGSVDRSIRVASAPSLITAAGLWYVCFRVGRQFEHLVQHQGVVGREDDDDDDPLRWHGHDFSAEHDEDGDGRGEVQESTEALELTAL